MLPFDNKSEFQVILDLPEGTTLETHARARRRSRRRTCAPCPRCASTEVYAGTAAPFNFNGLVRHYFMRRGANVADVQVNLARQGRAPRGRATRSPWRCGRRSIRIARAYGASAKIAEIPPGPPVLITLVAEVYGADDSTRLDAATRGEGGVRAHAGRGGRGLDGGGAASATAVVPGRPRARRRRRAPASSRSRRRWRWRSRAPARGCQRDPRAREGGGHRAAARARRPARRVEALLALPVATPTGPAAARRGSSRSTPPRASRPRCGRTCGR